MQLTLEKIKKCIDGLKEDLGEGFIFTDIWSTSNFKSIVFHHQPIYGAKPKHLKVFGETTQMLQKALQESDYPGLGNYYLINLDNECVAVIVNYRSDQPKNIFSPPDPNSMPQSSKVEHQQYVLVDLSKTTMGVLMNVALPRMIENLK